MLVLYFILLLLSLACFVASTFNVSSPRLHILALGLALWVAVPFIQTLEKM